MLEQDILKFKVYYERTNRRKAFKEIRVNSINKVHAEFTKLFPGLRVVDVVPVITNPE